MIHSVLLSTPVKVYGKVYPLLPQEIINGSYSPADFLKKNTLNIVPTVIFTAFKDFSLEVLQWYDGAAMHLTPWENLASFVAGYQLATMDTTPFSTCYMLKSDVTFNVFNNNQIQFENEHGIVITHDYSDHLSLKYNDESFIWGAESLCQACGGIARHWPWMNTMVRAFNTLLENNYDLYHLSTEVHIRPLRVEFLTHLLNTNWDYVPTALIAPPSVNTAQEYIDFMKNISKNIAVQHEETSLIL